MAKSCCNPLRYKILLLQFICYFKWAQPNGMRSLLLCDSDFSYGPSSARVHLGKSTQTWQCRARSLGEMGVFQCHYWESRGSHWHQRASEIESKSQRSWSLRVTSLSCRPRMPCCAWHYQSRSLLSLRDHALGRHGQCGAERGGLLQRETCWWGGLNCTGHIAMRRSRSKGWTSWSCCCLFPGYHPRVKGSCSPHCPQQREVQDSTLPRTASAWWCCSPCWTPSVTWEQLSGRAAGHQELKTEETATFFLI